MDIQKKIAVGMSGGVDSTFAAIILKEHGYEVIGITLQMYCKQHPASEHQPPERDFEEIKEICKSLSIPFHLIKTEKRFSDIVIRDFCDNYLKGFTPNPCVLCNKKIKWNLLLKYAKEFSATHIATGHYAAIEFRKNENRYFLKKGMDAEKDQSYFLWQLDQNDLAHTIFPLANFSKIEMRKKIEEYQLKIPQKPESQEICFIPNDDYKYYLQKKFPKEIKDGDILNLKGDKIGQHKGFPFYTIGQRRGLGITAPHPLYVKEIRSKTNEIVVGPEHCLFEKELFTEKCNWIYFDKLPEAMKCKAKIRYRISESSCTIFPKDSGVRVVFDEAVKSITPGQSVVFYDGDYVIGGGIIKR